MRLQYVYHENSILNKLYKCTMAVKKIFLQQLIEKEMWTNVITCRVYNMS